MIDLRVRAFSIERVRFDECPQQPGRRRTKSQSMPNGSEGLRLSTTRKRTFARASVRWRPRGVVHTRAGNRRTDRSDAQKGGVRGLPPVVVLR